MAAPFKDKNLVKVPVNLRLPRWLITWLRKQDQSQSVLIEEALREMHGITPPDIKPKK